MSRRIIDMRCRPAFLHDFFGATPGSPEHATARWLNRRVGTRGPDNHFERSLTQDGFLQEVRDAGLAKAVVVGRHTPSQHLPNDTIHKIVHGHDALLGIAGVDPALQGTQAALSEIERAIKVLGLSGVGIEPGFGAPPRHPDDALYWPVYELARSLGNGGGGLPFTVVLDARGEVIHRKLGATDLKEMKDWRRQDASSPRS